MSVAPAYRLMFRQTITVYNVIKDGSTTRYKKTVIRKGARLSIERQFREATTGTTAGSPFSLGICQGADDKYFVEPPDFTGAENEYTINNNDKVFRGEGLDIATSTEWTNFVPAKVAGVVVVKSYDPIYDFDGNLIHIEVGG